MWEVFIFQENFVWENILMGPLGLFNEYTTSLEYTETKKS